MAMCQALSNSLFASFQLKLVVPTQSKRHPTQLIRGITCCSNSDSDSDSSSSFLITTTSTSNLGPPIIKKRKRYRKPYPGEKKGITEEMRFVAMRLRNLKGKEENTEGDGDGDGDGESWVPSMEGFIKYLVDSKLVFETIERIVDKSDDVSYAYFRRTGLERAEGLAKDLEWFSQQDITIPEPGSPGVSYAKYLEDLAEQSAPLFLSHFYNIYFSHIASGQVIIRQVSEKLIDGRELEFYKWEGDVQELLKGTREKLNMLGEVDCLKLAYLIWLCVSFWLGIILSFLYTITAALVPRCEKQMFKRSNKVLQVFGADSPADHLVKQIRFHNQHFLNFLLGSNGPVVANLTLVSRRSTLQTSKSAAPT